MDSGADGISRPLAPARDFWIGLLILLLIEIALSFGLAGLMRPTGATPIDSAAMWLALAILLWGSAALIVKRLLDRDKSALWYPLFGIAPALCYHLGEVYSSNISNVQPGAAGLLAARGHLVDLDNRRTWLQARHDGAESLWPRPARREPSRGRVIEKAPAPSLAPQIASSAQEPFGLTKTAGWLKPGRKGRGPMNLDFQYLFTSFDGRINRAKYWVGTIMLAVISVVLGFLIGTLFGTSTFGAILVALVTLGLFYPGYAVAAKRFQDRDKPGVTALYGLVPVLIASMLQAFGLTGTPQEPNALGWICTLVTLGVGLWFLIDLGILKGTPGPNRFGGDPLAAIG